MKYSKLVAELEYWKKLSGEEDPEVVCNISPDSYEIDIIQPVRGLDSNRAIGIILDV